MASFPGQKGAGLPSTTGTTGTPNWNAVIPNLTFYQGTPATYSLPVTMQIPTDTLSLTDIGAVLPFGVSLQTNPPALVWSGTSLGPTGTVNGNIIAAGEAANASQDWTNRSTAPGVVAAYGFDSQAQVTQFTTTAGQGGGPFFDTSNSITGGAIRFDCVAGTNSNAPGGQWGRSDLSMMNATFGAGSTFYVQFRYMLTPSMITNSQGIGEGWKILDMSMVNASASPIEITTGPYSTTGGPLINTDIGAIGVTTYTNSPYWDWPNAVHMNNAGWALNSETNSGVGNGTWQVEPNAIVNQGPAIWVMPTGTVTSPVWITFYYKIHIGTLYSDGVYRYIPPDGTATTAQLDTSIELWVKLQGVNYWQKIMGALAGWAGITNNPNAGWQTFYIGTYMTGNSALMPQNASVWYDEFIVSTQPIALPIGP